MTKHKSTLVIAALLLGAAFTASATEPGQANITVETEKVWYGDLDLRRPAGVATLHWRLRVAANNVCFQAEPGLRARHEQRKCRDVALEKALAGLPPSVVAYHSTWKSSGGDWLTKPTEPSTERLASGR